MLITPDVTQVAPSLPKSGFKEMLTLTQEGNTLVVKVNYSSLSIIQSCARKAYYELDQGLVSGNESPATLFGSAIHAALEVFYSEPRKNRNIPKGFVEHSDLMAFGHEAPEEHFLYRAVSEFVKKAEPLKALPDGDKRSIANGVWILQHYFKTYIDDPFEVYVDEFGPVTERTCETVIHEEPGLRIILFGTIDVILKNDRTGVTLPADHKTSSIVGNDFYNRLKPNHQYTGYTYLAQKCLGITGDAFLVNCIQVKARPLTARGTPPNFPRQTTTRTAEDIAEYLEAFVCAVKDYLRWKDSGVWPLGHVDACSFWGGCKFREVCAAPQVVRNAMLENKFIRTKGEKNAKA